MTKYATSDLHLGHENIIKYAHRPFKNVAEMDEALISNWNARVKQDDDDVFILGDVGLTEVGYIIRCLQRMRGRKYLVEGNHDNRSLRSAEFQEQFVWIKQMHELEFDDPTFKNGRRPVILCHYAMRVWNRSHHGSYHLYGHSHGKLPEEKNSLSMDVGVDSTGYAPISLEEVHQHMSKKNWKPFSKEYDGDH